MNRVFKCVLRSTLNLKIKRMRIVLKILLLGIILNPICNGGKILFYAPAISKSIRMTFVPLAENLAKRGHQVTIVMPFEHKHSYPNLEILTHEDKLNRIADKLSTESLANPGSGKSASPPIFEMFSAAFEAQETALSHPKLKKYLENPKDRFDLVVTIPVFGGEVGYYLAHKFNADIVLYFSGQIGFPVIDYSMGQPNNPAYMPFFVSDYKPPLTFKEKLIGTIGSFAFSYILRPYLLIPKLDTMLDKHFPGGKRPSLLELEKNASLALHFGHPFINDGLRPVAPNFQFVGMMNCKKAPALSEDLQRFMDEAGPDGVIYVSFGSVFKASEMSDTTRKLFLDTFRKFPKQKFLWKWETEEMEDKPDNVRLMSWVPQTSVLSHPNMRLFISHGGQSSFQETLCYQKPSVMVSIHGDQHSNGRETENLGIGIFLPFYELTQPKLEEAIKEVLENEHYAKRAIEHGNLLMDQMNPPLERATWWMEFMIRHKGKKYYRSPIHDLNWFQYFLLDVIAVIVITLTVVFILTYKLLCCLFSLRKTPTKSKKD